MAIAFGVLHALEPGHGKTALLTYLASGRKTWKDGLVIALSSAVTHSLAVFFIAFASHLVFHQASHASQVEAIGEVLSLASGALIVGLGAWIMWKGYTGKPHKACSTCHSHHAHEHDHDHDHDHQHELLHDHKQTNQQTSSQSSRDGHLKTQISKPKSQSSNPATETSKNRFFTAGLLGVATGLIPCPSVVVAYLSGVSTGNSLLGLQNVILFAFGMSVSLMILVVVFSMGGAQIREKLTRQMPKMNLLNWHNVQGFVFIAIGLFTAFHH